MTGNKFVVLVKGTFKLSSAQQKRYPVPSNGLLTLIPSIVPVGRPVFSSKADQKQPTEQEAETFNLRDLATRKERKAIPWAELEAEGTVEAAGRLENVSELIGNAREFTRLDEFLEQVSLVADTDDIDDDDKVVLMTLHSAKGLEYPAVFLVGMEDGVFPHSRSIEERNEEEER